MTDMRISQINDELKLRAHAVLPGGHFGNMASDIVIAKGKEARIWDSQGNEYVDFLLGNGSFANNILGNFVLKFLFL